MQFNRKKREENDYPAPFKQLCLYLALATAHSTLIKNLNTIFAKPLNKRTIYRYMDAISPLFSHYIILFDKKSILLADKKDFFKKEYGRKDYDWYKEDNDSPLDDLDLASFDSIDKNNKKLLKLYRQAYIFDKYINYFNYHMFYYEINIITEIEYFSSGEKPNPQQILSDFENLGMKKLNIRTIERDIKTLKEAYNLVRDYKFATSEWWVEP